MIVTPVSRSPAITARCTGAAPRYRGRSDAWTLIMPSRGICKHGLRQDLAVGGDDADVGAERGNSGSTTAGSLSVAGCSTGSRASIARALTGASDLLLAAPARPIGLRHHADDAVRRGEQRVERRHRELRRAEEHDRERRARHHFRPSTASGSCATIRSRLMPRSRSTNSVPSR